jgi:glucose/arabinose dehydrogenase
MAGKIVVERLEDRVLLKALVPGVAESVYASGLYRATSQVFAPDGRLFVTEQDGKVRIIQNGSLLATPFLTVPANTSYERGLHSIELDPNFASNRFVYIYWTASDGGIHNRLSRFRASASNPNLVEAGSRVDLFDLPVQTGTTHHGGGMHFGPDGKLYIGVGENNTPSNSQTLANPLGKMLRINADGTIPTDNPFYNQTTGLNRAIWALGLRNPFTSAIDAVTGKVYANDVGQSTWEEVNDIKKGGN